VGEPGDMVVRLLVWWVAVMPGVRLVVTPGL